jgi:hypothetical protein
LTARSFPSLTLSSHEEFKRTGFKFRLIAFLMVARSLHIFKPESVSPGKRFFAFAMVGTSLAGLVYLRLFDPAAQTSKAFFPVCPFYALTSFHCPGCGTLRGLHQLLHGNFLAALDLNPLMVLTLPIIAYLLVSYTLMVVRGRGLPSFFVPPVMIKGIFWVVVGFWFLRNVPVYPFTLLAP